MDHSSFSLNSSGNSGKSGSSASGRKNEPKQSKPRAKRTKKVPAVPPMMENDAPSTLVGGGGGGGSKPAKIRILEDRIIVPSHNFNNSIGSNDDTTLSGQLVTVTPDVSSLVQFNPVSPVNNQLTQEQETENIRKLLQQALDQKDNSYKEYIEKLRQEHLVHLSDLSRALKADVERQALQDRKRNRIMLEEALQERNSVVQKITQGYENQIKEMKDNYETIIKEEKAKHKDELEFWKKQVGNCVKLDAKQKKKIKELEVQVRQLSNPAMPAINY